MVEVTAQTHEKGHRDLLTKEGNGLRVQNPKPLTQDHNFTKDRPAKN